jgi:hypothetical protein
VENTSFCGFSTGPYCQDRPAVVGRILNSGGLATIVARLEIAGLLYLAHFAGKSPFDATCKFDDPVSIHRHGVRPARCRILLQDLLLVTHRWEAVAKKNEV